RVTHTAETLRRSSTILSHSRIGFGETQDSMNTVGVQQREQPSSLRRVAVLGLGEAGERLAADLAAAGVEVRGFDPDPARDVRSISRVPDAASAASGCDVVLSVNSAKAALAAAEAALPGLQESGVYADANAASPELKREL